MAPVHLDMQERLSIRESFQRRHNVKLSEKGLWVWILVILVGLLPTLGLAQNKISSYDRDRAKDMLASIAADIRKHYYDPKFHGLDWDARVREANGKIDRAESMGMALSNIAAALDTLNDSHTFFVPPPRPFRNDYGWQAQMIGDRCDVILVHPQSDAEAKGMKPGDEVLTINGYAPDRANLWKMEYVFKALRPQPGLRLNLRDPAGGERQIDAMAKVTELKGVVDLAGSRASNDIWEVVRQIENERQLRRGRTIEMGDKLLILKLPQFLFSESEINGMIGKARKHEALILDLRGNPGGAVETLQHLVEGVFDREVKIGDRIGRDAKKPLVAKAGRSPFTGKLLVLVDSNSASAAELFARVVQIEKRGVVLGDRSSGSVMEAKRYSYHVGYGTVVFFGASITDADIVMTDGKSLEHTGVLPDEIILPTAADLASGRDPVLARAAGMLGVKLTAEDAGKMFPYEWPN